MKIVFQIASFILVLFFVIYIKEETLKHSPEAYTVGKDYLVRYNDFPKDYGSYRADA